jgi:hypothetical protein
MKPTWTRRKHSRIRKSGRPVHVPRLSVLMNRLLQLLDLILAVGRREIADAQWYFPDWPGNDSNVLLRDLNYRHHPASEASR